VQHGIDAAQTAADEADELLEHGEAFDMFMQTVYTEPWPPALQDTGCQAGEDVGFDAPFPDGGTLVEVRLLHCWCLISLDASC
jgi:hypothetical protein